MSVELWCGKNVLGPFDYLRVRVVVTVVAGESVGVHEATHWVTTLSRYEQKPIS